MLVMQVVADGEPGGGTTAVVGLAQDLLGYGLEVCLVTQQSSYAAESGGAAGAKLCEIDFRKPRWDLRPAKQLRDTIARVRPDLIHVHGGRAGWLLSSLWRDPGPPLVYTTHGLHLAARGWLERLPFVWAERLVHRRADTSVFVSEADARRAQRLGVFSEPSPRIIYNGVSDADVPTDLGAEKKYDVVFAARMHEQKDPMLAVEIAAIIGGMGYSTAFIGGGPLESEVAERVAKTPGATWLGPLGRTDVMSVLAMSRVYLLPSLWEGLPIGPIEAMVLGVPVVASNIPGTREVVADGVTGLLVEARRAEAYVERIVQLLQSENDWDRLSTAGRDRATSVFNRQANSSQYYKIYNLLLEDRARRPSKTVHRK